MLLWRLYQGGDGVGHLPDAGGVNDQPAWLLEAFAVMDGAEHELKTDRGGQ